MNYPKLDLPYWLLTTLLLYISSTCGLNAQTFTPDPTLDLKGGYLGFSNMVDLDLDGYLDISATGVDFGNRFSHITFYQNLANGEFLELPIASLPRIIYGDYSWADFDDNGTPDLLYSGTPGGITSDAITKVFVNTQKGCNWNEIPLNLPGISRGNSRWVDIDSNGRLDVFLVGIDTNNLSYIRAFSNEGDDVFTERTLTGVQNIPGSRGNLTRSSGRFKDLDGDGLPDLLLALSTNLDFSLEVYRNLGNFNFERVAIGLPRLSYVSMELEDMNNDGLIDLIFSGSPNLSNSSSDGTGDLYLFVNQGGFNFSSTVIRADEGVLANDLDIGDLDGDGNKDIIHYGTAPAGLTPNNTKIYLGDGTGNFNDFGQTLIQCNLGGVDLGDIDTDGDLDFLYFGRIDPGTEDEITDIYFNDLNSRNIPDDILVDTNCTCDNTYFFSLNTGTDVVNWTFGDPASGTMNTSTANRPSHEFTIPGTYTITVNYIKGAQNGTLTKEIQVHTPPSSGTPLDILECVNNSSAVLDLPLLKDAEILNGLDASEYEIFYYLDPVYADQDRYRLNMPYTTQSNTTFYARLQSRFNPSCYSLSSFELQLFDNPTIPDTTPLNSCDNDLDGFALFNLESLESELINSLTDITIEFYDSNNALIPASSYSDYQNRVADLELITALVIQSPSGCFNETMIELRVQNPPDLDPSYTLFACDDDGDGISSFFDLGTFMENLQAGQSNVEVTLFDQNGQTIPANTTLFTNTSAFNQLLRIRLENTSTGCFQEADLELRTSESPQINPIADLVACGSQTGFAQFDTRNLTAMIVGNQTNLRINFQDENGNTIPDFISATYQNTSPFSQEIIARVFDPSNPDCESETSFFLNVLNLSEPELEDIYSLCNNESSLNLMIQGNYQTYSWRSESGDEISSVNSVEISEPGVFTLYVEQEINSVLCSTTRSFTVQRSSPPEIVEIRTSQFAGNNFIEVIATGSARLLYSLDQLNYTDQSIFRDLPAGRYTVYVRDQDGCGETQQSILILDYLRFFSPNGDDINETWNLFEDPSFPDANIFLFDRYGKLLKEFNTIGDGWDGTINGRPMPSSDYWFRAELSTGEIIRGHFALIR